MVAGLIQCRESITEDLIRCLLLKRTKIFYVVYEAHNAQGDRKWSKANGTLRGWDNVADGGRGE